MDLYHILLPKPTQVPKISPTGDDAMQREAWARDTHATPTATPQDDDPGGDLCASTRASCTQCTDCGLESGLRFRARDAMLPHTRCLCIRASSRRLAFPIIIDRCIVTSPTDLRQERAPVHPRCYPRRRHLKGSRISSVEAGDPQ